MRVALVQSTPFPPEEGLGTYVWSLAKHLQAQGCRPEVFTRGSGRRTWTETREGIPITRARYLPLHPMHVPLHGVALRRELRRRRTDFDLVHLHSPLPPPVDGVGLPTVVTFHTPVLADTAAIRTRDLTAILYRLQTPFSARVERSLLRGAGLVTAVSPSVASDLARDYPVGDVRILPNGVDPAEFRPPARRQGGFLLCTGRLGPRKGHADLLSAIVHLRGTPAERPVVVTGKGPLEGALKARARVLGVDDLVSFRGHVPRDELKALLQDCDAFVFPTHYEGLPTSVLEAMSTACPVVTTAAPGVVDLVEHDRNALVSPVGDAEALADHVARVLDDPALARRLGDRAREDVLARHAWDRVATTARGLYEELLK